MQQYINYVMDFIKSFVDSIETYFIYDNAFTIFWNHNIINGTLLNINLTYREMLYYALGIFISIAFIVFIIKLIKGMIKIFTAF